VPRLPAFYALHQNIQIEVESSFDNHVDLDEGDLDVAILAGTGNWRGVHAERLLEVESFPVCSADFLAKNPLGSPHDLTKVPLLGLSQAPWLWPDWLKAAGIAESVQVRHSFDTFHTLYRAAVSGLGVALGFDIIVKPYLEETQLIHPLDISIKSPQAVYVIGRPADIKRPQVAVFLRWLFAEAATAASAERRTGFEEPLRKLA
jgi:LysR family glycine cleavage system transcriptional activator